MQQVVSHALHIPLDPRPAAAVYERPPRRRHPPGDGGQHNFIDAVRRHPNLYQILLQAALLHTQGTGL